MLEKELVIDGFAATLAYDKETGMISVTYKNKVIYTNCIRPDNAVLTKNWVGDALLKSVVEHYNKKEINRLKIDAAAKNLGWK